MAFNLYFAGASVKEVRELYKELGCCVLLSQFNDRSLIAHFVDYMRGEPDHKIKLFVDSGAWTAYTKGVDIDIQEYCDYINSIGDCIELAAEVDKIPGRFGKPVTDQEAAEAPEISWNNYMYMLEHVNKEYRDKIVPVFHYGEDFKYLKQILEYTFEDGHHIDYMGLGAIADLDSPSDRYNWFDHCFKMIKESSNPNIKVHAFGMTSLNILKDFPIYSADSTTWVMCSSHGNIIVDGKTVTVSERRWDHPTSLINKSTALQEEVAKKVTKYGYTVDQLSSDYIARAVFNVRSMQEWADKYEYIPREIMYKEELW